MEITRRTPRFSQETVTLNFVFHLIMYQCYENKNNEIQDTFFKHVFSLPTCIRNQISNIIST